MSLLNAAGKLFFSSPGTGLRSGGSGSGGLGKDARRVRSDASRQVEVRPAKVLVPLPVLIECKPIVGHIDDLPWGPPVGSRLHDEHVVVPDRALLKVYLVFGCDHLVTHSAHMSARRAGTATYTVACG